MYVISSGTPNNIRSPSHITHIILYRQRTLSVRTLVFENYVDMTETPLWSITNSGTWMLILAPTYSTKIFIDRTVMTTFVIPFVICMLLARDSIVGTFIPSSISLPASLFTRSVIHHLTTNSLAAMLARLKWCALPSGPRDTSPKSEWQILISKYANPTCTFGDTCSTPL